MQFKKLAALAISFTMAIGICGVIPVKNDFEGISVTASAASDFVIKKDSNGSKYVSKYTGKGGNITIPDGVNYIGERAFENNTSVTSVKFPASCNYIGDYAFSYCTKLEKIVSEGDACFGIGAFEKCINLQSVTVNGSILTGICAEAFFDCQSLKTVKIKKNENEFYIGGSAFYNCYSLTSINIPSKCTAIYCRAFVNCFNLTSLTIPAKTEINKIEGTGDMHLGYAVLFPTSQDCYDYLEGRDYSGYAVKAGSKSGYSEAYSIDTSGKYYLVYRAVYYNPKAITLTVTKGSPAEEWAKENKVKYKYASSSNSGAAGSSSSDSLAAPTGIKASKTSSSVTLSWNSVTGADAYRVYMYDPDTEEYEQYKDVSGTKCTVSGMKSGKTYKFKVAALEEKNGKYKAGKRSKAVSVKTK